MSGRRIWSLRLSWLAAYATTAKLGSQVDAGEALGCDQSTISRYIKDLQSWLGKQLVTSFSPFKLSPDGEDFLPVAIQVLDLLVNSQSSAFTKDIGIAGADIDMDWYTPPEWIAALKKK